MKSNKFGIFGFGDNSHGQIQHDFNNNVFVIPKANQIKAMDKFEDMVKKIHAGDKMSLITYENLSTVYFAN